MLRNHYRSLSAAEMIRHDRPTFCVAHRGVSQRYPQAFKVPSALQKAELFLAAVSDNQEIEYPCWRRHPVLLQPQIRTSTAAAASHWARLSFSFSFLPLFLSLSAFIGVFPHPPPFTSDGRTDLTYRPHIVHTLSTFTQLQFVCTMNWKGGGGGGGGVLYFFAAKRRGGFLALGLGVASASFLRAGGYEMVEGDLGLCILDRY